MWPDERLEFVKIALTFAVACLTFGCAFYLAPNTGTRRVLKLLLLVTFAVLLGNCLSQLDLGYRPVPWATAMGLALLVLLCFLCIHPELLLRSHIRKSKKRADRGKLETGA